MFNYSGICPICEDKSVFSSSSTWFREHLVCQSCSSVPRERALMHVINQFYPNYKSLTIHESSPSTRGTSTKLRTECAGYTASQYLPGVQPGTFDEKCGFRCEDLEALTFPDESFDLFISQDVMEHILEPDKAFKEIARVLKPGGAHIFTVPLINKIKKSECWASRSESGDIIYHHPAEYHGNPVDSKGALVTMHWGYDIASFISEVAKTPTMIIIIDNIELGIRAEYIDVLLSLKQ